LGQGISLIKADQAAAGKEKLLQVAQGKFFAASARGEAWHHLGIHALSEGDDAAYATAEKALDSDKAFDSWSVALRGRKSSQGFIAKARQRRKVPLSETNLQAGQRFLDENKKRKGVVTLESGLQYEILIEGNGTSPKAVDEVEVHYHGTLLDGEVFDSSVDREEPSRFGLGAVIAGWTEGLQLMKTGGTWKFFISPALAYGESGSRDIGPNETLTFEVELREVFPAPPPPQPQSESNATVVPPSVFRPEGNASIVVPTVPDGNGSK
jgi:FKBP-type peptidyl-prolyl cis-trans isomerase